MNETPDTPGHAANPFVDHLGIELLRSSEGSSELQMTVDERHLRSLSIQHGGVTAALLDSALGLAASSVAPEDRLVVTAQLNVNFVRPAFPGERLVGTGEVLHAGQQTVVACGRLETSTGELVATATATFLFTDIPAPRPQPSPAED